MVKCKVCSKEMALNGQDVTNHEMPDGTIHYFHFRCSVILNQRNFFVFFVWFFFFCLFFSLNILMDLELLTHKIKKGIHQRIFAIYAMMKWVTIILTAQLSHRAAKMAGCTNAACRSM